MRNLFKKKLIKLSSGHELRPAKGKCPVCKVGERQYCKSECTLIDSYNPMDR